MASKQMATLSQSITSITAWYALHGSFFSSLRTNMGYQYRIMFSYGSYRFGHPEKDADMERHVAHCFDYLRQSMLCAGDSALEGQSSTIAGMADGWGVQHVCKNNREVLQWISNNRWTNATGVD
jgi:hypothetical protein